VKHESLLRDEQKCKLLSQDEQDQIMIDLIEYLKTLDSDDYTFHGENEYGYQMSIAVSQSYGFCIDLCWDADSLWCYRDSGYVHPNLASVFGELRKSLVADLREIAIKWCGVIS
jgi:hypothetical protein